MSDPFADIRPYRDDEVKAVIHRVLEDPEFIRSVTRLRFGNLGRHFPWLLQPLVGMALRRQLASVHTIHDMQLVIEKYMDRMIEATTRGFSVSGLDALAADEAYLFMSNHRDIAMDPGFANYSLHKNAHQTLRIAIGDNLLTKPWVSDLMRLNKSFIVKRSITAPRQLLAAYRELSAYIHYSVVEESHPVWIAQREGRAKDGIDRTEPALIKMLAMNCPKDQAFADYIATLKIVPMAISYELDPCDALKAAELCAVEEDGEYEKAEHEDVKSIGKGITGDKGLVHVSYGQPIGDGFDTPEAVAAELDRQIIDLYCLHPTNRFAYEMLNGPDPQLDNLFAESGSVGREQFEQRIDAMPTAHRPYALAQYANAVVSKLDR